MVLEEVQAIRNAYRAIGGSYTVVIDNEHTFTADSISHILWDDTNERFTCIRSAQNTQQHFSPIEIYTTNYEHIQGIKTNTTLEGLSLYLRDIEYPNYKELIELIRKSGIVNTCIPTSSGSAELSDFISI